MLLHSNLTVASNFVSLSSTVDCLVFRHYDEFACMPPCSNAMPKNSNKGSRVLKPETPAFIKAFIRTLASSLPHAFIDFICSGFTLTLLFVLILSVSVYLVC